MNWSEFFEFAHSHNLLTFGQFVDSLIIGFIFSTAYSIVSWIKNRRICISKEK